MSANTWLPPPIKASESSIAPLTAGRKIIITRSMPFVKASPPTTSLPSLMGRSFRVNEGDFTLTAKLLLRQLTNIALVTTDKVAM